MNARRATRRSGPAALITFCLLGAAPPAAHAAEASTGSMAATRTLAMRAGKIDACKLISAAEAQKILGTAVKVKPVDTSAAGPDAASMCSYQTGRVRGGFMLLAGRAKYGNAAAEVTRREKEAVSDIPPGIPTPTFAGVQGLGEAAYLAKTSSSLELHVLQHGVVIVVTVVRKPDAATIKECEAVARVVLTHLAD